MDIISYLVEICLPRQHFFTFFGSALDLPLNMKILLFYPNFNKLQTMKIQETVRFEWVALHYGQNSRYWSIFATLRTHLEVYSVLVRNAEGDARKKLEDSTSKTLRRGVPKTLEVWLHDYKLLKKAFDSPSCHIGLLDPLTVFSFGRYRPDSVGAVDSHTTI